MAIRTFFILIFFSIVFTLTVSAEAPEKAAFIREHQLWIKEGDKETQITKNQFVTSPQWSKDGRFLGFLSGKEDGSNSQLFIYDLKEKEIFQHYPTDQVNSFKWSPISNQIAYNSGGVLNITKTKNGRPSGFENVALGVSSFEWFPNGKEFIVSSTSNLLPSGWEPVRLYKVPIDANLDTSKIKLFYTLPTMSSDFFAIDAEFFKWSADGKWLSFLATPTASWSMDSNYLYVISDKGENFQIVGKMLGFKDWIKWAPTKNQLAFISGEGRFFVDNKNAAVKDIPSLNPPKEYTPEGFVDLDIEWLSEVEVIVARAKEHKEWNEGPVPTMYSALYIINTKTDEQKQLTFPKEKEIDTSPQVIGSLITWTRKKEKEDKLDVWFKSSSESQEQLWIQNVDSAPVLYVHSSS